MEIKISTIKEIPFVFKVVEFPEPPKQTGSAFIDWVNEYKDLGANLSSRFRGVSVDRLDVILNIGIDVEPTDSIIFTDMCFSKAWEYGGWPKIILELDSTKLDRTFREVPADTPAEELEEIRKTFPTSLISKDANSIWFSRLHEDDSRITSDYEFEYARWIPGDPFAALRGIYLFVDPTIKKAVGWDF